MRCEICDRDVRRTWVRSRRSYDGAWFQGEPNPYPGPFPNGDGRGWLVPYWPHPHPHPLSEFTAEDSVGYEIFTCGDEVCRWRARHHGVPGVVYQQPARKTA